MLPLIQWGLGLIVTYYVVKGLLGKMQEGDFLKGCTAMAAAFALSFAKAFPA